MSDGGLPSALFFFVWQPPSAHRHVVVEGPYFEAGKTTNRHTLYLGLGLGLGLLVADTSYAPRGILNIG